MYRYCQEMICSSPASLFGNQFRYNQLDVQSVKKTLYAISFQAPPIPRHPKHTYTASLMCCSARGGHLLRKATVPIPARLIIIMTDCARLIIALAGAEALHLASPSTRSRSRIDCCRGEGSVASLVGTLALVVSAFGSRLCAERCAAIATGLSESGSPGRGRTAAAACASDELP